MYIICGLGNPGKEYESTRHNMGFLTMDVLSERLGIQIKKLIFAAIDFAGLIQFSTGNTNVFVFSFLGNRNAFLRCEFDVIKSSKSRQEGYDDSG